MDFKELSDVSTYLAQNSQSLPRQWIFNLNLEEVQVVKMKRVRNYLSMIQWPEGLKKTTNMAGVWLKRDIKWE